MTLHFRLFCAGLWRVHGGFPPTLHRDFLFGFNDMAGEMEGMEGLCSRMNIQRGSGSEMIFFQMPIRDQTLHTLHSISQHIEIVDEIPIEGCFQLSMNPPYPQTCRERAATWL